MVEAVYNLNCLDFLEQLDKNNQKVDCIITSPPYNMNLRIMDGKYVSRCRNKNHVKEFSTKYQNYTDDLPMEDYFNFQKYFLSMALRVSNLVFYNIQMITGNKVALMGILGEFASYLKEIIIWDKCHGQPAMGEGVLNSQFEFIFVFERDKPFNRAFSKANFKRGTETNLWKIKRERNTINKASFPTELVERILTNFTKEGDLIYDPFCGSGTTGVACKRLKRNFIGTEIDLQQCKLAKERIDAETNN